MSNKSGAYEVVKGTGSTGELERYRNTFEQNGSPRKIDNLTWLHQQNLAGTNTIFYAMHENNIAAIYTALPVVFQIRQQTSTALQSIDTITDEKHRGKGLFPKLANELYQDAEKNNFSLVYGFPNENSAPGFFKKLGWTSFGEAPFIIKPLSISYFIKKLLNRKKESSASQEEENHFFSLAGRKDLSKRIHLEPVSEFGEAYNELWKQVSTGIGVCADRSAAYMNWRYVARPESYYSSIGFFEDGRLRGVIVFTIKNKHQGRVGYIMELIYDTTQPAIGKALLTYANKICKAEDADVILAWAFEHSFNYGAYKKTGYFNFPVKFRPQHLFLGVRVFDESQASTINNISNWYISYSDSDTV